MLSGSTCHPTRPSTASGSAGLHMVQRDCQILCGKLILSRCSDEYLPKMRARAAAAVHGLKKDPQCHYNECVFSGAWCILQPAQEHSRRVLEDQEHGQVLCSVFAYAQEESCMRRNSSSQMPLPSFAMLAAGSVELAAAGGLLAACSAQDMQVKAKLKNIRGWRDSTSSHMLSISLSCEQYGPS